jgi:hypothetical protein
MTDPWLDPNKPDYPTAEQVEEVFNGYLKGGKNGIAAALDRLYPQRQDRNLEKNPEQRS